MSKLFLEILHKIEEEENKIKEREISTRETDTDPLIDNSTRISWVDLVLEFNSELDKFQLTAVHIDFINETIYCTDIVRAGANDDVMSGKKGRMKHLCLLDAVLCVLSNRIPSQQKLRMRTLDHHALFRACVITAKVRSNNALLFMKPLRLMLTPELYHAANDSDVSLVHDSRSEAASSLIVLNPIGCILNEVHYPWATIKDLRLLIERLYCVSRGSKVFPMIAQLCDVDFLQGNNTLIWVISDAVRRVLTSVLTTSEQIAIQGSTPAPADEQRRESNSYTGGSSGSSKGAESSSASQDMRVDSGGIGQAVASSFNQHPPQFMNTVEDLQKSGAIDPLLTSSVVGSDGSYNRAKNNSSGRPRGTEGNEADGYPKLQSIHDFCRDKNLQPVDPRVFMNRLATQPFQPAGGSSLLQPLSYHQITQNRSSLQTQQLQQQQQQLQSSGASKSTATHSGYSIGGNNPGNITNFGVQGGGSTAIQSNTSSSTMSKLLKNIPRHLHGIHLMHLKDCKARKFIPNRAKPEHPSHPLYHQFLEMLLQEKERLRKANNRSTSGHSGGSGSIPVIDLCESSPSTVVEASRAVRATPNFLPQQMPYPQAPMILIPPQPIFVSMPMAMPTQSIYSIPQGPPRVATNQAAASNAHPPREPASNPVQPKAATLLSPSSSFQRKKYSNVRMFNLENVLKTLENVVGEIRKETSRMSKVNMDGDINHTVRYSKSDRFSAGFHSESSTFDSRKMLHTLRLKKGLDYGEWCSPGSVVGLHPDGIEPVDNKRAMVIFVVMTSPSIAAVECEVPNPATESSSQAATKKNLFLCNSGIAVVSIANQEEVTEFRMGERNGLVYIDIAGSVHLTCDPEAMHQSSGDPNSWNRVFGIALRSATCFQADGSLGQSMGVCGVSVFLFSQMDFHTYQDQMRHGWRLSSQELTSLQQEAAAMSATIKEQKSTINHQVYVVKDLTKKVRQRLQDIQSINNKRQKSKLTGSLESATTSKDNRGSTVVVQPQSAAVDDDDLISIESYKGEQHDSQQEERYARYMSDGAIVLHDKALSIARRQTRKASEASSCSELTVRILSYPSTIRNRSSQTIDRITISLRAGRDLVDSMQPSYVTSLEERLLFTDGLSSKAATGALPVVMAVEELPILEHDIFTKFHRSSPKSALPLKRKMPVSFSSQPSDSTNRDNHSSSNPVSAALVSSPEKEDSNAKAKKKKGRPPLEHHRPMDRSESLSTRDARDELRKSELDPALEQPSTDGALPKTDERRDDPTQRASRSRGRPVELKPPPGSEDISYWECPACSLHNRYRSRHCAVCGTKRVLQFWMTENFPATSTAQSNSEQGHIPSGSNSSGGRAADPSTTESLLANQSIHPDVASTSVSSKRSRRNRAASFDSLSNPISPSPPPSPPVVIDAPTTEDTETEFHVTLRKLLSEPTADFNEVYNLLQSTNPPWTDQFFTRQSNPHLQHNGYSGRIYLRPLKSVYDTNMVFNEDYFFTDDALLRYLRTFYGIDQPAKGRDAIYKSNRSQGSDDGKHKPEPEDEVDTVATGSSSWKRGRKPKKSQEQPSRPAKDENDASPMTQAESIAAPSTTARSVLPSNAAATTTSTTSNTGAIDKSKRSQDSYDSKHKAAPEDEVDTVVSGSSSWKRGRKPTKSQSSETRKGSTESVEEMVPTLAPESTPAVDSSSNSLRRNQFGKFTRIRPETSTAEFDSSMRVPDDISQIRSKSSVGATNSRKEQLFQSWTCGSSEEKKAAKEVARSVKTTSRNFTASQTKPPSSTSLSSSSSSSSSISQAAAKELIDRSPQKNRSVIADPDVADPPRAKKRKLTELEHLLNSL